MTDFSDQIRKIILCYKRIGCNVNVKRQSACLVINPVTLYGLTARFKLHADESGVRLYNGPDLKLFILVGWDRSFRLLPGTPGSTNDILLLQISVVLFDDFWMSSRLLTCCIC